MPAMNQAERQRPRDAARRRALRRCDDARVTRRRASHDARRGAVLVEFALIAIAFYILMAGTIELGRMIFAEQILQNAARVGARELATIPLPPSISFQQALTDPLYNPDVKEGIFDANLLAYEYSDESALQGAVDAWPVVNRMLSALMVRDEVLFEGQTIKLFRYPGALLQNNAFNGGTVQNHFVVGIPQVDDAWTNITWHPVVEEIVPDSDPTHAPFSMTSQIPHKEERGEVALRINYPFQAATLTQYVGPPGVNNAVLANDSSMSSGTIPTTINGSLTSIQSTPNSIASYGGQFGLGALFTATPANDSNVAVRPFRRLLVAQSIFRREVFK